MKENFKNKWHKALKDAEVTPPEDLWLAIENELNKNPKKFIFPYWYTAASIAFLLVFGALIYNFNTQNQESFIHQNEALNKIGTNKPSKENGIEKQPEIIEKEIKNSLNNTKERITKKENKSVLSENPSLAILEHKLEIKPSIYNANQDQFTNLENSQAYESKLKSAQFKEENNRANVLNKRQLETLNLIQPKEAKIWVNKIQFRNILYFDSPNLDDEEFIAENKVKNKKWFGLTSSLAPFNPNMDFGNFVNKAGFSANYLNGNELASVAITGLNSSANYTSANLPVTNIISGRSFSIGFTLGKKLGKIFSLESGLKFLRGNSITRNNVYSVNEGIGEINSFYESAYLGKNRDGENKTFINSKENIFNRYDYLSLPFTFSAEIPLIGSLSASLLSGISADFFIENRNTGDRITGESNLTPANSNFKSLNSSFLAGQRFNYKIKEHWEAQIGVYYQQSLSIGLKEVENSSFRPRMIGINYGINYVF